MYEWLAPLFLLLAFEATADILAESWAIHAKAWIAALSLLSYLLGNIFWLLSLRDGAGLGRGAVIFSVVSALAAVVIGVTFYKEQVTHLEAIGFVFGLISIALILWR